MRTTRANNVSGIPGTALAISLLTVFLSTTQGIADPDADTSQSPYLTDSSTDRTPAVTVFPEYPSIAERDRIEGEVTVCFKITPGGRVLDPSVKSSTHKIFEKPALRAIRESTFEPLRPGQELRAGETCRTYRFKLEPIIA